MKKKLGSIILTHGIINVATWVTDNGIKAIILLINFMFKVIMFVFSVAEFLELLNER